VRRLSIFFVALVLGGCSMVRFAYENADVYLRWRIENYFDLQGALADELDERVAAFMAWHRAKALPQYAKLMDEAGQRFARGLQPADLDWGYDAVRAQAKESLREGAERLAPLLDRLSPREIAHFERRLAEDNRKFERENLRGSERERRKRRTERNVERLEDWLGALSQTQVERVALYSARAPLLDEFRNADHKRLQAELVAMLRAREARKRLADVAANWERGRDPAYAAALDASRKEYIALALDLERSLSREQRARAAERLARFAEDFRTLSRERR
jgi:hypothetical protein